jgi:hypothetical protein
MDKSLALISRPTAIEIQKLLAPNLTITTSAIDLVISLESENLNLRDCSRFLVLIDRAYGRLLYGDLRKYAWNKTAQIRISEVRPRSWEIVLTQILHVIQNPTPILVLYVLLRLLPRAFQEGADAVMKLSTAYNNYEQARLARANRKNLRDQMNKDEQLGQLSNQQKKQLAEIIDVLLRADPSITNPALDFSETSFRKVTIRIRAPK